LSYPGFTVVVVRTTVLMSGVFERKVGPAREGSLDSRE